jgi:hypothetical protein
MTRLLLTLLIAFVPLRSAQGSLEQTVNEKYYCLEKLNVAVAPPYEEAIEFVKSRFILELTSWRDDSLPSKVWVGGKPTPSRIVVVREEVKSYFSCHEKEGYDSFINRCVNPLTGNTIYFGTSSLKGLWLRLGFVQGDDEAPVLQTLFTCEKF